MEFRFCPFCATELVGEYVPGRSYLHCPTGHYTYYPSQIVGVAGVISDGKSVLLERRAIAPGYGLWALPGGMAEQGESTDECLVREVREETGLDVTVGRLLCVKGGQRVCIVVYDATVVGGTLAKSDESLDLQWFPLAEVLWQEFAFPRHREALEAWLKLAPSGARGI